MVKIPEVYWVQKVSVWLRKAFSSINWFSSVIQQLQLTRCSDTSAIPAHYKHHLCPCALAWASAAARAGPGHWATPAFGLTFYSCFFNVPPALTLLPQLCRVMVLPRETPLALPEGQNQSVTGLVMYV